MRLVDMSVALRRQHVIFALNVVLQDIRTPASTMDIARLIAARLETSDRDELRLIGRIIVSLAPKLPQARQGDATFRRYGKDMRPWIWSPKTPAAGQGFTRDDKGVWCEGAEQAAEIPEWDR